MRDKRGREYAKLSRLRAGGLVELDEGFDCMSGERMVHSSKSGLYVLCREGRHYLRGQADNGEDLVGIYSAERRDS